MRLNYFKALLKITPATKSLLIGVKGKSNANLIVIKRLSIRPLNLDYYRCFTETSYIDIW